MKTFISVYAFVAFFFLLTGCEKEKELSEYSTLGIEADKANIKSSVAAFQEEMTGLSETNFAQVSESLASVIDSSISIQQKMIYDIASIGQEMTLQKPIQEQFQSLLKVATNDCSKLSYLWNNCKGVWDWNTEVGDFERSTTEGDEIILNYPYITENDTNIISYRVYNFSAYEGNFSGKGETLEDGTVVNEITQQLFFEMKVDSQLVASSNLILDFNADGTIENVNMTFNPLPYSFEATMTTTTYTFCWTYTFSNSNNTIFNQRLTSYFENGITPEATANSINSSIQINDILLVNETNTIELIDDIVECNNTETDSMTYMMNIAEAVNQNNNSSIRYVNHVIITDGFAVADIQEETTNWCIDLLFEFVDGTSEVAKDLFDNIYIFESDLELTLKKARQSLT